MDGTMAATIQGHEKSIATIRQQLTVQEAKKRAGLPHRNEDWFQSARFALARYEEELEALQAAAEEEAQ